MAGGNGLPTSMKYSRLVFKKLASGNCRALNAETIQWSARCLQVKKKVASACLAIKIGPVEDVQMVSHLILSIF
jgi:hypothetical protein